jgi:hypothetical protein
MIAEVGRRCASQRAIGFIPVVWTNGQTAGVNPAARFVYSIPPTSYVLPLDKDHMGHWRLGRTG